jgi:hypothetical protein
MDHRIRLLLFLSAAPLLLVADPLATTTMTADGSWQDPSKWSGGVVPDNGNGGFDYDVTLGANRVVDSLTDVTVTNLATSGSAEFRNSATGLITVEGTFTHLSGDLVVNSSLGLWLKGLSTVSGEMRLQNGSGLRNDGTLNVESSGTVFSDTPGPTARFNAYHFFNTGTTNLSTGVDVTLQNFAVFNAGLVNVALASGKKFSADSYVQVGTGTTLVTTGATLQVNNLDLTAGTVLGTGTYFGSNINFGTGDTGAIISAGDTLNSAGALTFAGNMAGMSGSTLRFDLGGTTQGLTYDHLILPGGNFIGATLEFNLINGFTPASLDSFTIITGNNFAGAFSNLEAGTVTMSGIGTFDVGITSTAVTLTNFTPIPEPATCALLSAGLLVLAAARRRRRAEGRAR